MSAVPFQGYEREGRRLLGRPSGGDGSSRRGYGVPVFEQCGSSCVYCGLGGTYEAWLNLSVDHVVPRGDGKKLGYPVAWIEDITNLVTCCRTCNEFLNGYRVNEASPATLDEFYDLRYRHFVAKRERVLVRHKQERAWYDQAYPPSPDTSIEQP